MKRFQAFFFSVFAIVLAAAGQQSGISYPIEDIVGDAPYILYSQGSNPVKWCVVTEKGNGYKVVYGMSGGEDSSVDSLNVSSPALAWGLTEFAKVYKPSESTKTGQTDNRKLTVRSADKGTLTVKQIDLADYASADADNINNLYYTLYWLANPKLQKSIESPAGLAVNKLVKTKKRLYNHREKGWYGAVEFSGGTSLGKGYHPEMKSHNMTFFELDAAAGWKFSEKFGMGLGVGGRKYFKTYRMFAHSWGMPIYLDLRGDAMSYNHYKLAPFWVLDLGMTIPDGFMFRPQIGFKFGQPYKFTLSVAYMGQFMRKYNYFTTDAGYETGLRRGYKRELFSCISVRLGYEF